MFDRMKERFLIAFYSLLDLVDSLWVLLNLILIARDLASVFAC